jgi:hypothetical protein
MLNKYCQTKLDCLVDFKLGFEIKELSTSAQNFIEVGGFEAFTDICTPPN